MRRFVKTTFSFLYNVRTVLIIGFLPMYFSGYAQSTVLDTARTWSSYETIDLYSNQSLPDTFNIYLSASVMRLTHGGTAREFPVSNIQGSWSQIEQAGELTFDVLVKDLYGKGKLQRSGGVLCMIIDLSERKDWMKRKFIISEQ